MDWLRLAVPARKRYSFKGIKFPIWCRLRVAGCATSPSENGDRVTRGLTECRVRGIPTRPLFCSPDCGGYRGCQPYVRGDQDKHGDDGSYRASDLVSAWGHAVGAMPPRCRPDPK